MPSALRVDWHPARPAAAIRAEATITRLTLMNLVAPAAPRPGKRKLINQTCAPANGASGRIPRRARSAGLVVLPQHVDEQEADADGDRRIGQVEHPREVEPRD